MSSGCCRASPPTSSVKTLQRQLRGRGRAGLGPWPRAGAAAPGSSPGRSRNASVAPRRRYGGATHPKSRFWLGLSFFPTTVLPGWPKRHRSAPLGAQRVGIWRFLGQCHRCSKTLGDGISQSSPGYFGFSDGGGVSTQNALQRFWGAVGWWQRVPGLSGGQGPQQDPAWAVVPRILGRSIRSPQETGGKGCGSHTSRAILSCSGELWGGLFPFLFSPPKSSRDPSFGGDTKTTPHTLTLPGFLARVWC